MKGKIVNLDELEATRELHHGERFDAKLASIGARIGARKLGYNVIDTGASPLRRLAVSAMIDCDVWHFPDSKKFLRDRGPRSVAAAVAGDVSFAVRRRRWLDYWHGE